MKILVAEDDLIPRRVLERTLMRWGYSVAAVADGDAAWEILSKPESPRLVILDWLMPKLDGLEIIRRLRRAGSEDDYVYILLLTGKSEPCDIVAGLEAGADDYLTKPFEPTELRARLRVGRRLLDLHCQLVTAGEQLRERATRDPLTGILNRGAILDQLQRELARGRREGRPVAVLLADVDHFKKVNDSHGHPVGDAVLRGMTARFGKAIRSYDGLGRYGGEEFLVVLPDCDRPGAMELAERLRKVVSGTPIVTPEVAVSITTSIGVTVAAEPDPAHLDWLLSTADRGLYRAKSLGRDRVEFVASDSP